MNQGKLDRHRVRPSRKCDDPKRENTSFEMSSGAEPKKEESYFAWWEKHFKPVIF